MKWTLALLLATLACQRAAPPPPDQVDAPAVQRTPVVDVPPGRLDVAERWVGGAVEGDAVPVVVAVHGLGDDPSNFGWITSDWAAPARVVLPRAPTRFGKGYAWMTIRSGQGLDEELAGQLAVSASRVASLCDALAADPNTVGKPVITGFSQGGMIAYAVAVRHPDSVAGAVPVSGWLPEPLWPGAGEPVAPIRALHGDVDRVIEIGKAQRTAGALQAAGADATLQIFPGVGHVMPPAVRAQMDTNINALRDAK